MSTNVSSKVVIRPGWANACTRSLPLRFRLALLDSLEKFVDGSDDEAARIKPKLERLLSLTGFNLQQISDEKLGATVIYQQIADLTKYIALFHDSKKQKGFEQIEQEFSS